MENIIDLVRMSFEEDWTLGRLYVANIHFCYTVEDEIRDKKIPGDTAIPAGVYKLSTRISPKFSGDYYWSDTKKQIIHKSTFNGLRNKGDWKPHEMIWITDVPNYQYILLHWGNTDDDTEGCLVVGDSITRIGAQEGVINSRVTYMKLYPIVYPLIKVGDKTITIK